MRVAIYARVSTLEQQPEKQLAELRRYADARGWTAVEYVDHGVSGAKDKRPALDTMLKMQSDGSSTCFSAGGWIGLGAT
jgi:DNA invertase Pin-like site-specific DNA recombinase